MYRREKTASEIVADMIEKEAASVRTKPVYRAVKGRLKKVKPGAKPVAKGQVKTPAEKRKEFEAKTLAKGIGIGAATGLINGYILGDSRH